MTKQHSIRIPDELMTQIDEVTPDIEVKKDKVVHVIEQGLNPSNVETDGDTDEGIELDDTTKHSYFKHLKGGKGKEYQTELAQLDLTEQELVDLALELTGIRFDALIKQGLLMMCKQEISLAYRNQYLEKADPEDTGRIHAKTPISRIQDAFAELTDKMETGEYRPRNNRISLSVLAQTSKTNYNTVKKWAEKYQPELLQK